MVYTLSVPLNIVPEGRPQWIRKTCNKIIKCTSHKTLFDLLCNNQINPWSSLAQNSFSVFFTFLCILRHDVRGSGFVRFQHLKPPMTLQLHANDNSNKNMRNDKKENWQILESTLGFAEWGVATIIASFVMSLWSIHQRKNCLCFSNIVDEHFIEEFSLLLYTIKREATQVGVLCQI